MSESFKVQYNLMFISDSLHCDNLFIIFGFLIKRNIMKKVIVFISVIVLVGILPSSCVDEQKEGYNDAISKADMLLEQSKYDEAKVFYLKALEYKPKQKYPTKKIKDINKILESQKLDSQYNKEIEKANSLFKAKKYNKAKYAYIVANKLKPEEELPMDMIRKIDGLLSEYQNQEIKDPFNLIVGSFKVESNALKLNKMLKSKGYDSKIIDWNHGFKLVTFGSYPDIHKAYNKFSKAKEVVDADVWVFVDK